MTEDQTKLGREVAERLLEGAPDRPADMTGFHGKAAKIIVEAAKTDEPIFILRAKDLLSTMAVKEYLRLLEEYQGGDHEMLEGVAAALNSMRDWQRANPGLVRLPD